MIYVTAGGSGGVPGQDGAVVDRAVRLRTSAPAGGSSWGAAPA